MPSQHQIVRIVLLLALATSGATGDAAESSRRDRPVSHRRALFGDLHVHTAFSFDAYVSGTRADPNQAYAFARGAEITLADGERQKLRVPLDFAAVTDHAEFLSDYVYCTASDSPISDSGYCRKARTNSFTSFSEAIGLQAEALKDNRLQPRLAARGPWAAIVAAADRFNDPGRFTTIVGFEYSKSIPRMGMLHRNVLFRNKHVPEEVLGSRDLDTPEMLWDWLDSVCRPPCEALAIPHNTNYSWGNAFKALGSDGLAMSLERMRQRRRLEPLVEIIQIKGNSECTDGVGSSDEECNFEQLFPVASAGSMVREGLKLGLELDRQYSVNPFRLGFVGGTDTHNATPGATDQRDFRGHISFDDNTASKRLNLVERPTMQTQGGQVIPLYNAGGLTGVWATENTRDAIFDAMQRREVFATSGTRLQIAFFGGWTPVHTVPALDKLQRVTSLTHMGGILPAPLRQGAPTFIVWALKDPRGARIDRVQIVKGWISAYATQERVFDITCSDGRSPTGSQAHCPAAVPSATVTNGCTVDDGQGWPEILSTWKDPEFDPTAHAFYYVRVLERPTCRWSTLDAIRLGVEIPRRRPASFVQQRAWSSPIWYRPAPGAL